MVTPCGLGEPSPQPRGTSTGSARSLRWSSVWILGMALALPAACSSDDDPGSRRVGREAKPGPGTGAAPQVPAIGPAAGRRRAASQRAERAAVGPRAAQRLEQHHRWPRCRRCGRGRGNAGAPGAGTSGAGSGGSSGSSGAGVGAGTGGGSGTGTDAGAGGEMNGGASGAGKDPFGIKQMYPTLAGGNEWFAKWDANPRNVQRQSTRTTRGSTPITATRRTRPTATACSRSAADGRACTSTTLRCRISGATSRSRCTSSASPTTARLGRPGRAGAHQPRHDRLREPEPVRHARHRRAHALRRQHRLREGDQPSAVRRGHEQDAVVGRHAEERVDRLQARSSTTCRTAT